MKKNFNVIQIKGIRGLMLAGLVVCCLFAGFVVFPGWVVMHLWNYISSYFMQMPNIYLAQGVLLWAIVVVAYFTFRKEKVVVCVKNPQGLSEEELKEVFANVKRQSQEDPILQAMLKARDAELKIKSEEVIKQSETEATLPSESNQP